MPTWVATGAQIKHYFSICSWGCFWIRLISASVDWVDRRPVQSFESLHRTRGRGRRNLTLFLDSLFELSILSHLFLPWGWDVLSSDSKWITTQALLRLQLGDSRLWDFSVSIIMEANSLSWIHIICTHTHRGTLLLSVLLIWKTLTRQKCAILGK